MTDKMVMDFIVNNMSYLIGALGVLMIIMYTCAIFYYPERLLNSGYSWVLTVNPVYCVIVNVRNIIFNNPFEWDRMLYAVVFSIVSVVFGCVVFKKNQDKFILHV